MASEDVDVRHHRQLHDDDEEEQARGLCYVGRHHGAFGVRLCVIRAVTASSAEKSTYGAIWICLYNAVSLWPTCVTTPIRMPAGKSDGYCFDCVPAVTITSPCCTFASFGTKSSRSEPSPWPCRTSPFAPVFGSRAGTALVSSVSSVTCALLPVT